MEALERKYNNFKKSYMSLGRAIDVQKQLSAIAAKNTDANDLFISGVIQHFEITYETAWKFLKQYLMEVHDTDIASPKQIFRTCETYRIFPEDMVQELIILSDARNTTTHIYDQVLAQEVCNAIIKHYHTFGEILNHIKMP